MGKKKIREACGEFLAALVLLVSIQPQLPPAVAEGRVWRVPEPVPVRVVAPRPRIPIRRCEWSEEGDVG